MSNTAREKNSQIWLTHIKEWEQSGLTREEFCKKHGINASTFGYWITKSRKGSLPLSPSFIPVRTSRGYNNVATECIQVRFSTGMSIHIPGSLPIEVISKLICSLGALP